MFHSDALLRTILAWRIGTEILFTSEQDNADRKLRIGTDRALFCEEIAHLFEVFDNAAAIARARIRY